MFGEFAFGTPYFGEGPPILEATIHDGPVVSASVGIVRSLPSSVLVARTQRSSASIRRLVSTTVLVLPLEGQP
jgi:hypothetical protein